MHDIFHIFGVNGDGGISARIPIPPQMDSHIISAAEMICLLSGNFESGWRCHGGDYSYRSNPSPARQDMGSRCVGVPNAIKNAGAITHFSFVSTADLVPRPA